MADTSTAGPPQGVPDDRYVGGFRAPTTVLPLRKSFTVWEENVPQLQVDNDGEPLMEDDLDDAGQFVLDETGKRVQRPVYRLGRQGSKPRYRFWPDAVKDLGAPGRLEKPMAWHSITRDQLMDFVRCGQVTEDGKLVIDRDVDPADGAYVFTIGEVPEDGNPDEIPIVLTEEV